MSLTLMLSAARLRHSGGPVNINLSDVLTSAEGLSENADGEYFVSDSQRISNGGIKDYTFKPDPLGRKVKKITAKFRYDYVHRKYTSELMFYRKVGSSYTLLLGVRDSMTSWDGFDVFDDTGQSSYTVTGTTINKTLTRTLSTPIPLNELVVKIGANLSTTYMPIYISNLVFEYE